MTDSVPLGEEAYADFREKCIENWYIELRDVAGTPLVRLNCTDPRVVRLSDPGANPVTLRFMVPGSDLPALPVEITSAALYRVATDGTEICSGSVEPALLTSPVDMFVIVATIYQPSVPVEE